MISKHLRQVQVPTTGAYVKRAAVLADALEAALNETLDINVLYERRGDDPKAWHYHWELPDHVAVSIDKSRSADPRIWVYRSDPVLEPPMETDWKNRDFERNYDTKLYHVGAIAVYVRDQLEYNRKKLAEHQANQEARGHDLTGVVIPDGVTVERNPKTGRYELFMRVAVKELDGEEVKLFIAACRDFKKAVAPVTSTRTKENGDA